MLKEPTSPTCRTACLALVIAVAACGDLGFVAGVTGRQSFQPPAIYRTWWSETEACSGRQAPFQRVVWFTATGLTGDGLVARGRWSSLHEIIIVAGYENDPMVVRHEILHDLLNGDRLHERNEWDRCWPLQGILLDHSAGSAERSRVTFQPRIASKGS